MSDLTKVIVRVGYEFQMTREQAEALVGRAIDLQATNRAWENSLERKVAHLAPTLTISGVTASRPKVEVE